MIDWQECVFQVLIDPDSAEIDAAMTQLFGALHDRDSAWHTQAVEVLRQLYEHFSATDPRQESLRQENIQFRKSLGPGWSDDMDAMRDEAAYSRYGW